MAGHTIQVSILADTKQFSSAMKKLSGETGLTKLGNGFKTAGSKIASFVKKGVLSVTALGAAIGALALKGGFERALNIEDAQAKLSALGHDTKSIDAIMQNALASVKGTAYGLGDAATLAGQAVAAGIKPGQDLERQLKLVTNAAALSGTSMGEMGSIFAKVWTSGRAQTQELNQIADRGIPIWTKLAEKYGVSATELRKMVSQGKVDAETFAEVMEGTVGNAALAMGDTTRGAFMNMRAALSRAGEAFLKGIFPSFAAGLGGITDLLDKLTPYAEKAGKALGDWLNTKAIPAVKAFIPVLKDWLAEMKDRLVPVIEDLKNRWDTQLRPALERTGAFIKDTVIPALKDLGQWLNDNRDKITLVTAVVGTFFAALAGVNKVLAIVKAVKLAVVAFKALSAAMLANPIGLIIAGIAALVAGLVWFFTQTETGKKIWEKVWSAIKTAAAAVADWFTGTLLPALSSAWETIKAAASAAADWYNTHVAPLFEAAAELIATVFNIVREKFEEVWGKVQAIWDTIGGPVLLAIGVAVEVLKGIWDTVWNAISAVLEFVWNTMKNTIETVLGVIRGIIETITAAIKGDWKGVWDGIKSIASTIWDGIKGHIENMITLVKNIISGTLESIRDTWNRIWNRIKDTLREVWDNIKRTVREKIDDVIEFIKGMPGKAKDALANIGNTLLQAGRNLIQGFIDGINEKFQNVRNTLSSLTDLLPDWKGPASKDRNLLRGAGQLVIAGFIDGMESQYRNVRSSLTGLTRDVGSTRFDGPQAATAAAGAAAGPVAPEGPVTIVGTLDLGDGITAGLRGVADFSRMGGLRSRMAVGVRT